MQMNKLKITAVLLCCLTGLLAITGCTIDNKAETATRVLPAEVQAMIDSGTVADITPLAAGRAGTGSIAIEPVLYPGNYIEANKRNTPAVRLAWNLNTSTSAYSTYVFYINDDPARIMTSSDYWKDINPTTVAAFLDRAVGSMGYSITAYALGRYSSTYIETTGTYSNYRLSYGYSSLGYEGGYCYIPTPDYWDYAIADGASRQESIAVALSGGSVSYWVHKGAYNPYYPQEGWYKDVDGYAGGCIHIPVNGLQVAIGASPKIFSNASKIGIASRLCRYPDYSWTGWSTCGYDYIYSSSWRSSLQAVDGIVGFQMALYLC